ncbi:MAG: hypothetical protein AB7P37_11870 [Ramlibacter sp.]
MKARHWLLGLALAATAAAALWLPSPPPADVVQAAPRRAPPAPGGVAPQAVQASARVLPLRPRTLAEEGGDSAFAARQWSPTAAPAQPRRTVTEVVAAPAPPPQAPAAPFKVIGRYEEAGQLAVFLEHQQATLVARAGDSLTADWKVQSIDAGRLVLLYLPLSQKQVLEWASP